MEKIPKIDQPIIENRDELTRTLSVLYLFEVSLIPKLTSQISSDFLVQKITSTKTTTFSLVFGSKIAVFRIILAAPDVRVRTFKAKFSKILIPLDNRLLNSPSMSMKIGPGLVTRTPVKVFHLRTRQEQKKHP